MKKLSPYILIYTTFECIADAEYTACYLNHTFSEFSLFAKSSRDGPFIQVDSVVNILKGLNYGFINFTLFSKSVLRFLRLFSIHTRKVMLNNFPKNESGKYSAIPTSHL